jgi:hypothetical protein
MRQEASPATIDRMTPPTKRPADPRLEPVVSPTIPQASWQRISPLAPAYYLGRPAHVWFEALRPKRRPVRSAMPETHTPAPLLERNRSTLLSLLPNDVNADAYRDPVKRGPFPQAAGE